MDPTIVTYWIAVIIGLIIVSSTSIDKFAHPTYDPDEDSDINYARRFKPIFQTSDENYRKWQFAYVGFTGLVYIFIAVFPEFSLPIIKLINNGTLPDFAAGIEPNQATFPLTAVAVIFFLQNVPLVKKGEERVRRWLHRLAKIPKGVDEIIERLLASNFNFEDYGQSVEHNEPEFLSVNVSDFILPRTHIRHKWAKACCLLFSLRKADADGVSPAGAFERDSYDTKFFELYKKRFEAIQQQHKNLKGVLDYYLRHTENESEYRATELALDQGISDLLKQLYSFIACAVCSKESLQVNIFINLNKLGFLLPAHIIINDKKKSAVNNVILLMIGTIFFVFMILVMGGAEYFAANFDNALLERLKYVPKPGADALIWGFATASIHGIAAWVALSYRAKLRRKGTWFTQEKNRPWSNYGKSALIGGISGLLVLLIIGFTLEFLFTSNFASVGAAPLNVSIQKQLINVVWVFLPMATAAFAVYHFDTMQLRNRMKGMFRRIAVQALVMAVLGFAVSQAYLGFWHILNPQSLDGLESEAFSGQLKMVKLYWLLFIAFLMAVLGGLMGYVQQTRAAGDLFGKNTENQEVP